MQIVKGTNQNASNILPATKEYYYKLNLHNGWISSLVDVESWTDW